jgi:serine/threonine-protein phosphatase 2A regulatory subunit A
LIDS